MLPTKAYAVQNAASPVAPFNMERREAGPHDILITIDYCGICHTDIHQVRNEWGGSFYPMVPGHEIVGHVAQVGAKVTRFKAGDVVGVGCFVDSCRECHNCQEGLEQFCEKGMVATYNSKLPDGSVTFGGYSSQITVDEAYVLKITSKLPLERIAPLLCAGITTYSPMKHFGVKKGQQVAIVGLGGLGHMGVKNAVALGAEVTVLSTSAKKEADAKKLGAHHFAVSSDPKTAGTLAGKFDFILDTVSAPHDINGELGFLKRDGTLVVVGASPLPTPIHAFSLIMGRKRLAGSLIGGIKETQEMLDFCAEKNIGSDVEVIPASKINEAYERMLKSDVKYRFVIDMKTL
jgi:uncharacterized zinc-type alcohol dehydrogenase-like protein